MKQNILSLLADLAVREAVSPEAARLVATRLNLIVPLVDLLVGKRTLSDCGDIDELKYANALGWILDLPGEAMDVRPASMCEVFELRGQTDDYVMLGKLLNVTESDAGLAELKLDPLRHHMKEIKAILMPAVMDFLKEYGEPLNGLARDLCLHIVSVPVGLISIAVTYIAHDHVVGLARIAPLLRQLPQALPIGVLDDDQHSLVWTIITD